MFVHSKSQMLIKCKHPNIGAIFNAIIAHIVKKLPSTKQYGFRIKLTRMKKRPMCKHFNVGAIFHYNIVKTNLDTTNENSTCLNGQSEQDWSRTK